MSKCIDVEAFVFQMFFHWKKKKDESIEKKKLKERMEKAKMEKKEKKRNFEKLQNSAFESW